MRGWSGPDHIGSTIRRTTDQTIVTKSTSCINPIHLSDFISHTNTRYGKSFIERSCSAHNLFFYVPLLHAIRFPTVTPPPPFFTFLDFMCISRLRPIMGTASKIYSNSIIVLQYCYNGGDSFICRP
jgi:hypothetical protein